MLVQGSPFFDDVNPVNSVDFATQLNFTNASGQVTYEVTNPVEGLTVYPGGRVLATRSLPVGTYSLSGTATDTEANTGSWVFNLTVTDMVSPGSSVVAVNSPSSTALPTGIEVLVPFQIGSAGGVSFISDYSQIMAQHIETIVLTVIGERLMLPLYGTTLYNFVFMPTQSSKLPMMANDIKTAITNWEQNVNVLNVNISTNPQQAESTLIVTVDFSVVPYSNVSTVVVSAGGAVQQVSTS
jgi:phage baseplate assembly protein W